MEYTVLGTTGKKVSRIGYGGATAALTNYLEAYDPSKEDDRDRIYLSIEAALAVGINYYDTAPAYGNGESEELLSDALRGVKGSGAHPLFIATKIGYNQRASLLESIERILKHLNPDSI